MVAHRAQGNEAGGEGQPAEDGERIAKVLARAGVASRREVERLIADGRLTLNGQPLTTPAVKIGPADIVALDGKAVAAAEATRLFRYHKPVGLVTTHNDPRGRPTVFEGLPPDLPRLISVGRLDFNSEGLLLLTNDGGLARALELPTGGLVRRYRVRARGRIVQARLDELKEGITVSGVRYGPIDARLDASREGAANVWLTVSLAEGKNREVRRVLEALDLMVNRLIRVSYGPFELGELGPGKVDEVSSQAVKRLADKVGASVTPGAPPEPKYKPGWARPKIRRSGGPKRKARPASS